MLAISQSGESAETCLAAEARPESMPLICITNDEQSRLAGMGDIVLPLLAGQEEGTIIQDLCCYHGASALLADAVLDESVFSAGSASNIADLLEELTETIAEEVDRFLPQFGDFHSAVFTGQARFGECPAGCTDYPRNDSNAGCSFECRPVSPRPH